MKKLLLSFALIAIFGITNSFSQCTPNVTCVPVGQTFGICPDSTSGLAIGCVGVPYSQVVSIKVPADGTDFGQPTAQIVDIEIKSISGLAPGLSHACSPTNCKFPKLTNGCALISGTPTAVHNQQIVVTADAHVKIFGIPITQTQTFSKYFSIVNNCVGISDGLDLNAFDVKQNSPNPFSDKTEIVFSSPVVSDVEFKVYNVIGAVVYNNSFKANKGANTITVEANSFAPGVYIYSISNGTKTITKRMIVSSK